MTSEPGASSMAVFCDFENVALGVKEANYANFDIDDEWMDKLAE